MKKRLIILGTAGNCIDILDTIHDINYYKGQSIYECDGFLDDNEEMWGKKLYGVKVLGPLKSAPLYDNCFFVNGIGSPFNFWKKDSIISETQIPDERFVTLVHPTAHVSKMSQLGFGTVVFQNVTITSNVTIGNHVIILPNSVINHDDTVGNYTCITSGVCVSGCVKIGKLCYLGANSSIIGNITIGDYCLIGIGSVVLKSVADNSVVVGNPAKFIRNTSTR
jgi:sugar O-acyltransferase (sialic acid O-acetyltransferase NeuD family)